MSSSYTCLCERCATGPMTLKALHHWPLCVELVQLGWDVRETVSELDSGQPCYNVQIARWSWHGESSEKVDFWGSCDDLTDEGRDKTFSTVAHRAVRAWNEYPHCIPYQDEEGSVRPHRFQVPPWPKSPLVEEYWDGERMVNAPDQSGGPYHA